MPIQTPGQQITREAAGDLSALQFHLMQIDTNGQVDIAAGQGQAVDGVLQNNPAAAGQAATVMINGISKVVAGETITTGVLLTTGADGRAEIALTGDIVIGKSLSGADNGETIDVLLYGASHVLP